MKNFIWLLLSAGLSSLSAQGPGFQLTVTETTLPGWPGLQSFAQGRVDDQWVLLGGRTDGLHRRQPFAAFDPDFNNDRIYVVDLAGGQSWSAPLTGLPAAVTAQLQSSNMQFLQREETLYLVGGYGYSPQEAEWVTHPQLLAVDLPGLAQAVIQGTDLAPHFRMLTDERLQVTGGYLGWLDGEFYLVGGQHFEGRYNPMGPNHGPGFFQAYTNAIRKFQVADDGQALSLANYNEVVDTAHLHRRDLNVVPQVFPDGTQGFTVFSGVFRYDADLPWLHPVDITPAGHTLRADFQQFLSHYHCAHLPLFSAAANEMHTVFLGGISQYFINPEGVLTDDPEVPFVRTISLVTRGADNSLLEYKLGDLPGLLGASAAFLPAPGLPLLFDGIIDLDALADGQVLGHLVGGIESSLPNVFFLNGDDLSVASARLFELKLSKTSGTEADRIGGEQYFGLSLFPNPLQDKLTVNFSVPVDDTVRLTISDAAGRILHQEQRSVSFGLYERYFETASWPAGTYQLEIRNDRFSAVRRFVKSGG